MMTQFWHRHGYLLLALLSISPILYLIFVFEASTSEPESPIVDLLALRRSLSDRILDALAILRCRHLSPFVHISL